MTPPEEPEPLWLSTNPSPCLCILPEALLHKPMIPRSVHNCDCGVVSSIDAGHVYNSCLCTDPGAAGQPESCRNRTKTDGFPDVVPGKAVSQELGGIWACVPAGSLPGRKPSDYLLRLCSQRTMTWPASATIVCPVMVRALSEHRNTTASAMSCPLISRLRAVFLT